MEYKFWPFLVLFHIRLGRVQKGYTPCLIQGVLRWETPKWLEIPREIVKLYRFHPKQTSTLRESKKSISAPASLGPDESISMCRTSSPCLITHREDHYMMMRAWKSLRSAAKFASLIAIGFPVIEWLLFPEPEKLDWQFNKNKGRKSARRQEYILRRDISAVKEVKWLRQYLFIGRGMNFPDYVSGFHVCTPKEWRRDKSKSDGFSRSFRCYYSFNHEGAKTKSFSIRPYRPRDNQAIKITH